MKRLVVALVALVVLASAAPALAACSSAGSIVVTAPDTVVGQVWIRAGSFSVSPMLNGTSVWFATQDGGAETILILINKAGDPANAHVKVADLAGQAIAEGDLEVPAGQTFTLSVAAIVKPHCP